MVSTCICVNHYLHVTLIDTDIYVILVLCTNGINGPILNEPYINSIVSVTGTYANWVHGRSGVSIFSNLEFKSRF